MICIHTCLAQDITLLDSFHFSEYLDNNWELINGNIYDQNMDGSVTSVRFQQDIFGERIITSRSTVFYDANGNVDYVNVESYDQISSTFNISSRTLFTYDDNNNLLSRVNQVWDETLTGWVDSSKWEFSFYDEYNNYALSQQFDYSQSAGWIEDTNIRIENFYENDLLDSSFYVRNSEPWYYSAFDYNDDDLVMEDRTIFYFLGEPDFVTRTIIEYNDQGLRSYRYAENFSLFLGESEYAPSFQQDYIYTPSGELQERISERYDDEFEEFNLDWKRNYFYPQSVSVKNLDESALDVQWNNSMIGQIGITINDLDHNSAYRISLIDNSGRIVKNLRFDNSQQWSQHYRLESGMYHLVVYSEEGNIYSKKLVVQ